MKSILACLTGLPGDHAVLRSSGQLAKMFRSHVDALHVYTGPEAIKTMIGSAGAGSDSHAVAQMARELGEESEGRLHHARAVFDEMVLRMGLPVRRVPDSIPGGPTIARIEVDSVSQDETLHLARTYDLVVMAREDRLLPTRIPDVVRKSGRPVLLASAIPRETIGKNIAVLWKPGPEAARALALATPFLCATSRVTLVMGMESGTDRDSTLRSARALQGNLAWRGLQVQLLTLDCPDNAGITLRDALYGEEADLIVMGAYSHSRTREAILGGVTRTMLESCDIPVLMAH